MSSLVSVESVLSGKSLVTMSANERLLACVDPHVVSEMTFGTECFVAHSAFVRLDALVNLLVLLQLPAVLERFSAVFVLTLEFAVQF